MFGLWKEYLKNQLKCLIKYRMTFWASIFNILIKLVAMGMVWKAVYGQQGNLIQYSEKQMLIYSTVSIALAQCMTWWDGPHMYALNSIKKGTIIFDITRPVNFMYQLFCRGSSVFFINIIIYFLPTIFLGNLIFDLHMNFSLHIILFLISIILGYLILFGFQMLLSLVSVITLELDGVLLFFHAVMIILSCEIVPLEMYPMFLQKLVSYFPFKYIFYFPLVVISERIDLYFFVNNLMVEVMWILAIYVFGIFFWSRIRKFICIQGG